LSWKDGVFDVTGHFGAKVFNVKKDVVFFLNAFVQNYLFFFVVRVIVIFFSEVTVDLNVDWLELVGCSISTFVLYLKMNFLQLNRLFQIPGTCQLNFDNEKVFTWNAITIRINATLKHFKLSLWANFDSSLRQKWSILEICSVHVFHVHKITNFTILN